MKHTLEVAQQLYSPVPCIRGDEPVYVLLWTWTVISYPPSRVFGVQYLGWEEMV